MAGITACVLLRTRNFPSLCRAPSGIALSGRRQEIIFQSQYHQSNNLPTPIYNTMAVAIRLRREGSKHRPFFRIIVADSRTRRDGRFIDQIGTYDPLQDKDNSKVDLAKADAWIGKGAQPSETVASLIRKARMALPKA